MAFVPSYEHDIFVSYAHVDDIPDPNVEKGWVTTLVEVLRNRLTRKLGREEEYSLWIDHQLARYIQITPDIIDTVQNTAILLVILSPGYMASEWCQRERNAYLNMVQERAGSDLGVFIVEYTKIDERPAEFKDVSGYRFWKSARGYPRTLGMPQPNPLNPSDQGYYDLLSQLSHDMVKELRRLKDVADVAVVAPDVPAPTNTKQELVTCPTVFLAEVTDDLDPLRDEVKRYFEQANLNVLPKNRYIWDPASIQEALDGDIAQSDLFVQPLSNVAGKRLPDSSKLYTRLQYERAIQAEKPIMQWRKPDLDMDAITDADHRALLEGTKIFAVGIEEFKRRVVEQAKLPPPPPPPPPGSKDEGITSTFIFLDTEKGDRSLAEDVGRVLVQHGEGYVLPMEAGTPAEIREDLEDHLLDCKALIIVYGGTTVRWVRGQLLQCRKIISMRKRPLQALAIYEGPPVPKAKLDMGIPAMQTIDCCTRLDEEKLKLFLDSLQSEQTL